MSSATNAVLCEAPMNGSILVVGRGVPFPIATGADAARFGMLSALSRSFRVTLVAIDEGQQAERGAEGLRRICEEVVLVPPVFPKRRGLPGFLVRNANLLLRGRPRTLQSERHPHIGPVLDQLTSTNRFQLAHFDYWTMAEHRRFAHCPAVLLNFDAWFETIAGYARYDRSPLARFSWTLESRASRRREAAAQRHFDWSLFFTEEDRSVMINAVGGLRRSAILPLACPFDPVDEQSVAESRDPLMLFTGAMGAPFNVDAVSYFVQEIWPSIRACVPEAQFLITGREPHRRVLELGATPGVTVAGWVPDLDDLFRRAAVFVAPMRIGTGVKIKVAHAMARGVPVVGSTRSFRGLPQVEGLIGADDPIEFAERVVDLLLAPPRRQELGQSVLRAYREQLWLEAVWPKVVELYERIVNEAGSVSGGS